MIKPGDIEVLNADDLDQVARFEEKIDDLLKRGRGKASIELVDTVRHTSADSRVCAEIVRRYSGNGWIVMLGDASNTIGIYHPDCIMPR